jgi:hypothetical protein
LPILDCYFFSLVEVWIDRLGGKWLQKNINEFVAACARPVAGPKSTTERAAGDRLYRFYARPASEKRKFDEFAYTVRCTWGMLEANTPWTTNEDVWFVAKSIRKGLLY